MENAVLALNAIRPGMFTAEPVLDNNKQIILQQDIELTSHMINLLQKWKINSVCVRPAQTETDFKSSGNPRSPNQSAYPFDFSERYHRAATLAGNVFEYMRSNEQLPYDTFHQLAHHGLYELTCEKAVLANLYRLKPSTDYTYLHAVDVGIIAGLIGRWCGFEERTVQSLILAGVMHDIGKSQIPRSILDKPSKPSDEQMDILKLHPVYGYYMVKSISDISSEIEYAILQHHERMNGGGYPAGIHAHRIHPFAKIISIADVYDALTSNRVYKKSITPFAALDILVDQIFTHFDHKYCKLFIQSALKPLIGSTVLLSDQSQAKVLYFSYFMSAKPVVQKEDGSILDLNQPHSASIVEVVKFS
ncbi:MAG: HD-GYP domain-containing protein [Veillonellales bacterium]